MLRRAFVFLAGSAAIAGCGVQTVPYRGPSQPATAIGPAMPGAAPRAGGSKVAILLPLSGQLAGAGQPMLQAAQLALPANAPPTLVSYDTGGTPDGAATAARTAIAEGARMILGPLTSAETAAVAPIATQSGVPVLAFTNASVQAQPGVWTLGISPAQQVRRLVAAAAAQGKTQMAALLPDNDFGRAMADGLVQACAAAGLPAPSIHMHAPGMGAITTAARDLASYGSRRGPIDAQIRAARAQNTPEGRRQAADLARSSVAPPPFQALLLGDTKDELALVASVLPYYDVDSHNVQFMGPALWAAPGNGGGAMQGAWYAAPDGAARAPLEEAFQARYNTPPPPLADLAFDAASIARVLATQGGFSIAALTQPAGFAGVTGWLGFQADGQVRRGLAVFRIERSGPAMVEPAPSGGGTPGA